jgi:HD-GYP domain-containing protein (c-di-GMP phosphodiesterase class II)
MRRLIEFSNDLLDANLDELSLLGSAIAKRDSDTDAHNYRVSLYSVRLAEAINLDETLMHSLIKGSFLHDVGKIGIRDDILLKQGSLDEEQFSIMKTHVMHGSDIIKQSAWLKDSLSIVTCHHEKFDGSGYPSGLKGDEIPLVARIFVIADVFDALTSIRPYKEAIPLEESLKIMEKGRGSHFDPKLLDVFQTIAPGLYTNIKNREIEDLLQELDALVHTYFSSSMATLQY